MDKITTSKLFIPWIIITVLFMIGFALEIMLSERENKVRSLIISTVAGMLISAFIIGLIYLVATTPTQYDDYDYEVANKVSVLPVHTATDNTVIGIVTEIDEKVVVTANLKILSSPNNAVFYQERLVNYEIETDAELQVGDEVAITRGIDGVFKYSGRTKGRAY